MTGNTGNRAATSFGQQMRQMRQSHHWTLREMAAKTGVSFSVLSRVETGDRPPTERVARALDAVFPELPADFFLNTWSSSRLYAPAGFVDWSEVEDTARDLLSWTPGIIDGLGQVEGYARAMLSTYPGATGDQVEVRLKGRMARQRRLFRDEGPAVILLVDMAALYRGVGSADVMAEQCAHLAELAKRPNVTVQVVPPVAHPLGTALLIVTDQAAYTENAWSGSVFTDEETVRRMRRLVGSVSAQARPASETRAIMRKAEHSWTGERAASQVRTAGRA
jgi:transcriptional regulator with XRE-family HTH domain